MATATVCFGTGASILTGNAVVSASAELCFARTERGEAEVRCRLIDLPSPTRDLLFALERHLSIDLCLAAVRGAQLADAMALLSLALIRTFSFDAVAPFQQVTLLPLIDALLALPTDDLYTLLTHQAKRRLGLLQGFRMVLALERCNSPHEQRALAVRFVQEIWRTHGVAGVVPLQRLLSA